MNSRRLLTALAVLCVLAFGAGLLRLFLWRFDIGDIYPPYSSMRTDPLGTRALHDALGSMPGRQVGRFLLPTRDLPSGRDTCLLLLGSAPTLAGSEDELADLDRFLAAGGRLILALDLRGLRDEAAPRPQGATAEAKQRGGPGDAGNGPPAAPPAKRRREPRAPEPDGLPLRRLMEHWGLGALAGALVAPGGGPVQAALQAGGEPLPATLEWPAAGALELRAPQWTAVYGVGTRVVVARRQVGNGTLIALADSYLFSNEGLREALQPTVLSWLLGPAGHILFDETHLGIQKRFGVMTLARRYRLHGLAAAMLCLALLYLWHSLARPLTAAPAAAADGPATGRAAPGALRDLLRHHLPPEALLEQCLEAWQRTAALPEGVRQRRLEQMRERLRAYADTPRRRRDTAACYRELCDISARKD